LDAYSKRGEVENDINKKSDDVVRDDLSKWVRNPNASK